MKILVDTLGADKGYKEIVNGALKALENHKDLSITFIGDKNEIEEVVSENSNRIDYIDTKEYIKNDEEPALAIRRNKNRLYI